MLGTILDAIVEACHHALLEHIDPTVSLNDLAAAAERPWAEQMEAVFETCRN